MSNNCCVPHVCCVVIAWSHARLTTVVCHMYVSGSGRLDAVSVTVAMVFTMYGRKWSVSCSRPSLHFERDFRRQTIADLPVRLERHFAGASFGVSMLGSPSRRGFTMIVMFDVQIDRVLLSTFVAEYLSSKLRAHNIRIVYCKSRQL